MATAPKAEPARNVGGLLRPENLPVVLIVAAMVVGIAALLPLVQSSESTSTAGDIRRLEEERTGWQTRLQELEIEVAGMGSLDRIEKEARMRFKMTAPENTEYISVDAPPPEARKIPSRYLPDNSAAEPSGGSSVWEDLFGWMPLPW
jgi:cell division protein FtsL